MTLIAIVVFVFTYVAFSVGRVPGLRSDRMGAAVIGGVALVALRVLTITEAQVAVDASTLGLLFGMMILSAGLEISGCFALVGWWVTRRAQSPLRLLAGISIASAVLSAFLINDVVCIAFTPLVLQIAKRLERDPRPYLLALATSSNIGSVATITGNPQNILIGSLSHISYARFALALAPIAVIALAFNVLTIWILYRKDLIDTASPRASAVPAAPVSARSVARAARRRRIPRVYRRWVRKSAIVSFAVFVAFLCGVPPVIAALLGACTMMFTRAVNPKRLYVRIDWTLLALFAGLFVVVAGVEKVGLAERLLHILEPLHPESSLGLTAVTALLSNIVSNVPAVMVLKSVVPHLPHQQSAWLTLAMASTLAGNLTLPGSIATIIVIERAKSQVTISFLDFLKVGLPTGLISLVVGALWLEYVVR